jgi:hypothetical protein
MIIFNVCFSNALKEEVEGSETYHPPSCLYYFTAALLNFFHRLTSKPHHSSQRPKIDERKLS